jgi:hypothetical protein
MWCGGASGENDDNTWQRTGASFQVTQARDVTGASAAEQNQALRPAIITTISPVHQRSNEPGLWDTNNSHTHTSSSPPALGNQPPVFIASRHQQGCEGHDVGHPVSLCPTAQAAAA